VKVSKYKLAAFFAFHMGQVLPVPPFPVGDDHPGVLLGGRAYRWQRQPLAREDRLEFLTSILRAGRGFPRPSKTFLRAAEVAAERKLTTDVPVPPSISIRRWGDVTDAEMKNPHIVLSVNRNSITQELKRTCRELFEGKQYTNLDRLRHFVPSTSANYIRSRAEMGAVGELFQDEELFEGLRSVPSRLGVSFSEVGRLNHDEMAPQGSFDFDFSDFQKRFETFYLRLLEKAWEEVPAVEPLALPEALKARVITKGPPYLMTALKPLQRFMWKTISRHPAFELTGRPIDARYIQKRLGKRLLDGQFFLSGDWTDATNEISSWASEVCVREISQLIGLSGVETELFHRSLTGHVFSMGLQRSGQLMGSITSFPILCVINAAICRFSAEQAYSKHFTLVTCPLMINGDDVGMRLPSGGRDILVNVARMVGLRESVGKSYWSREFINMNSTNFSFSSEGFIDAVETRLQHILVRRAGLENAEGQTKAHFRLTPYVNLGLLFGMKRSGGEKVGLGDVVGDQYSTLGSRARFLASSSPVRLRDAVIQLFVNHHLRVLRQVRVPWFVDESLGGVGLPSYFGSDGIFRGPTLADAATALQIKRTMAVISRGGGQDGWQFHSLAKSFFPCRESVVSSHQAEATQTVLGVLYAAQMFRSDLELDDLFLVGRSPGVRALRRNERVWSRLFRNSVSDLDVGRALRPLAFGHMGLPIDDVWEGSVD